MKKIFLAIVAFAINAQFINAQTNTPPLPNGETKIGEHLHVGAGNEVWTDAANLYFNYRGNAAATYFWNKNGSTGSAVLSILNNGKVGIGTTNPQGLLQINSIRPILFNNNGGNGVYGSEIGFNAILNTGVIPNQFKKLGGTNQQGGAAIVVDHWGSMYFQTYNSGTENESIVNYNPQITFSNTGNVGIGTTNPQNKLDVAGTIRCTEVKVVALPWADFVFHPTYNLRSLGEVEQFIKTNSHLPEIPTEAEVKENGVSLGEMNAKLLQKIEELTLYLIEMQKRMEDQQKQINAIMGLNPSGNTPATK